MVEPVGRVDVVSSRRWRRVPKTWATILRDLSRGLSPTPDELAEAAARPMRRDDPPLGLMTLAPRGRRARRREDCAFCNRCLDAFITANGPNAEATCPRDCVAFVRFTPRETSGIGAMINVGAAGPMTTAEKRKKQNERANEQARNERAQLRGSRGSRQDGA
jgi:hypothetical protein